MTPLIDAPSLLREARRRSGLTQAELGVRGGVAQSVVSAYEAGRRDPSLTTLLALLRASGHALDAELVPAWTTVPLPMSGRLGRRLVRHRAAVRRTVEAHGGSNVRVFGSVARGEDRPGSDVDLLVDLPPDAGLFALGRLRGELEALLGAPVDVVPAAGLKAAVRTSVERDLLPL